MTELQKPERIEKDQDYGRASEVVTPDHESRVAEWQPIKTAPKHDTVLLAHAGRGGWVGEGWFDRGDWWFFTDSGATKIEDETDPPTHWMPQPHRPGLGIGACDSCGKPAELTAIPYGEQGNSVADGSFCDECRGGNQEGVYGVISTPRSRRADPHVDLPDTGKANPSPPTQPEDIETHKQMFGTAFVYDGHLLDPSKVEVHTAQPVPIQPDRGGLYRVARFAEPSGGESLAIVVGGQDDKWWDLLNTTPTEICRRLNLATRIEACHEATLEDAVPIQGEGPYTRKRITMEGAESEQWFMAGPTGMWAYYDTDPKWSADERSAAFVENMNAAYQAGASSKDQVVEAAAKYRTWLSHRQEDSDGGYVDGVNDAQDAFNKCFPATALNPNTETEQEK